MIVQHPSDFTCSNDYRKKVWTTENLIQVLNYYTLWESFVEQN